MTATARSRHYERGAAVVEFAVASVLLLTLMFGIIDFGRGLYAYSMVINNARLGARYAIVRGSGCTNPDCPATKDSIQDYVRSQSSLVDPTDVTVTSKWPGTNSTCSATSAPYNAQGCLVSVQVTYQFQFILPLIPTGSWPLSSTSQMVISQ
jgi:Flp pilus assembly protein TadG